MVRVWTRVPPRSTYPLCAKVFISNPRVGLVFETSSPQSFFTIVVFPALSSPLCVAQYNRQEVHHRRRLALIGATRPKERGGEDYLGERLGISCQRFTYTMRSRISFSFAFTFLITVRRPMTPTSWIYLSLRHCKEGFNIFERGHESKGLEATSRPVTSSSPFTLALVLPFLSKTSERLPSLALVLQELPFLSLLRFE